jgi:hypothetical protein
MIFNKRELRIRVAKIDPQSAETEPSTDLVPIDPDQIEKIARNVVRDAAVTIGIVVVAVGIVTTVCESIIKSIFD